MAQTCQACASPRVLRNAEFFCRGFMGPYAVQVQARVASLFKRPAQSPVLAHVCLDCGHVELRASRLEELQRAPEALAPIKPLGLDS